jgi:hypothetical protein
MMNRAAVGLARVMLPKRVRARLYDFYLNRRIERLPSRRFLDERILPALAGAGCRTALFVGVGGYNRKSLRKCRDSGMILWTIDIDPNTARWGAVNRHIVGDLCLIDRLMPAQSFDAVIINGVFSYGIDDIQRMEAALNAVATTMKEHGVLVVGGQSIGYRELESVKRNFVPCRLGALPPQMDFSPDSIQAEHHRYDIYRRERQETWHARRTSARVGKRER